jgi:hypothetical protein
MQMQVDPRAEWAEIFNEAWPNVRDYFVNPELIQRKYWSGQGDSNSRRSVRKREMTYRHTINML